MNRNSLEAWRISFDIVDGEPLQIIHPDLHTDLPFVDLSSMPAESRDAEAVRLATRDTTIPIPLDSVPLFRILVVCLTAH